MRETSLEPLITECPSCRTRFRVSEMQLSAAGGRVRCGACLSVFQGTDYLIFGTATSQKGDAPGPELDALLDELDDATRVDAASRKPRSVIERAGEAVRPLTRKGATVPFRRPVRAEPPPDPAPAAHVEPHEVEPPASGRAAEEPGSSAAPDVDAAASSVPPASEPFIEAGEAPADAPSSAPVAAAEPVAADAASSAPSVEPPVAAADATATAARTVEPAPAQPDESQRDASAPAAAARAVPSPPRTLPALAVDVDEAPPRRRVRFWQPLALVLLIVALAAQVLWLQFASWSVDPQMRPVYELSCRYLGCKLAVMRDLAAIHTRNLVVRSHPDAVGALQVDALIVNEASFPQPFPLIELRFTSMSGEAVAGRRFAPSEYLSGELAGAQTMQPRTPVHIALEIEDPGKDAVNYVVMFR